MTMSLCLYVSMSQCLFADSYLSIYLSFHCVWPIFPSINFLSVHAMHTPPTSRHTPHARCKLDIPHAYLRTLHAPLDCKLYTSHCKLHTSHWARNAQRCISHPAYWTLQMKTIHCKHYSPRHAHSTHQSPHPARQMQTRHSTCLPPHSTHSRIKHTQRKSARWRKVPNKYGEVGQE